MEAPIAHVVRRAALALAAGLATLSCAAARSETRPFHEVELTIAVPSGVAVAVSYAPMLSLLRDRLHVGVGPRFSAYFDERSVAYPNGDAALLAAGARNTLTVRGPRTYALDLMLAVSARVFSGLELGLNIDLIGVGVGPSVTGDYAGADPGLAGAQRARPTTFNLLLLGTHDRGQLDSEFFAAYWLGAWDYASA